MKSVSEALTSLVFPETGQSAPECVKLVVVSATGISVLRGQLVRVETNYEDNQLTVEFVSKPFKGSTV
jgi:hypothetical protein